MQVSEVMTTNPTCCVPADTAQTAAIIMRDEDTGIVPVVQSKSSRTLAGVVTDRDLCLGVLAESKPDPANIPIEQCMTAKVITCTSDADLDDVLKLMQENQVRRVLVVDGGNTLKGIVSLADLMNRGEVSKGKTRETLESISKPSDEASKPRAESAKVK